MVEKTHTYVILRDEYMGFWAITYCSENAREKTFRVAWDPATVRLKAATLYLRYGMDAASTFSLRLNDVEVYSKTRYWPWEPGDFVETIGVSQLLRNGDNVFRYGFHSLYPTPRHLDAKIHELVLEVVLESLVPTVPPEPVEPRLITLEVWSFFDGSPELVDVDALWAQVSRALEPYPFYRLIGIRVEAETRRIIFTVEVPVWGEGSPIAPAIWKAILAVIKVAIIAVAATAIVVWGLKPIFDVVFYPAAATYACPVCGIGDMDYLAFSAHMASEHPEAWEKLKPIFEKVAPKPFPWKFVIGGLVVIAAIGLARAVWKRR